MLYQEKKEANMNENVKICLQNRQISILQEGLVRLDSNIQKLQKIFPVYDENIESREFVLSYDSGKILNILIQCLQMETIDKIRYYEKALKDTMDTELSESIHRSLSILRRDVEGYSKIQEALPPLLPVNITWL